MQVIQLPEIPTTFKLIALTISGLVGIFAAYYINAKILPWYQKYQDKKTTEDLAATRAQMQDDNAKANAESDKLKAIDGR